MSNIIAQIEKEHMKENVPQVEVGDTVKVFVKVVEGTKERLQAFEGVVIAIKHGSVRESFTVRRVSYGIGVERTFPLHSPRIDRVEVVRKGKVRRAKLYYLRDLTGKKAKLKEKETVAAKPKKAATTRTTATKTATAKTAASKAKSEKA